MIRKSISPMTRRPAPRRILSRAALRPVSARPASEPTEALLAHWTAMQQAMQATGDLRR